MKSKRFIILFHPIGNEKSVRIDFESENIETDIYEDLKIDNYEIYQFIQEEFKYNMEESELQKKGIKFESFKREKKTWFGLSKKIVSDLLIFPQKDFFYPYQYGHYFYLFTKSEVNRNEFEGWMNSKFPEKFADFDETYAGLNKAEIKLLNENDYLIITNHDYQSEFGVIGNSQIIAKLIERLKKLNLNSFEEEKLN